MDLRLKWKNRLVSIHGGADFIYGQFGMGAACIVKLTFDHVWAGVQCVCMSRGGMCKPSMLLQTLELRCNFEVFYCVGICWSLLYQTLSAYRDLVHMEQQYPRAISGFAFGKNRLKFLNSFTQDLQDNIIIRGHTYAYTCTHIQAQVCLLHVPCSCHVDNNQNCPQQRSEKLEVPQGEVGMMFYSIDDMTCVRQGKHIKSLFA